MSTETYRIEEHWDPAGHIKADSDPVKEFEIWRDHAKQNFKQWDGTEFTLADFESYIESLKQQ